MILIGSDHAGFELKTKLIERFQTKLASAKVEDVGTHSMESCDYPLIAEKLCQKLLSNSENLGILICGTGIGMSIAANKIKGIRAGAVSEKFSAQMAREHNKAQILCLGARVVDLERAWECVNAFLNAKFDLQNPRHQRRVDEIAELERR